MIKYLVIAAGLATLITGSSLSLSPAQASWAESAQGNPVYNGTNRSLRRSERARRHFSHRAGRANGWAPGYSAYGAYNSDVGYGFHGSRGYYGGY
jgi:hypothetical protein